MDTSVIIPAREEIYLERTIRNVLENAEGEIEILVMLDGWIPEPQIVCDERVTFVHFKESIGQRAAINEGARRAKGKYLMKLDAHCAVDKGFDVKLAKDCEYDWTVIPRMYNLDINTWKPKPNKKTDYMYIGWNDKNELRSLYYTGSEWKNWHKREELIDDTMGCMGPGFFMHKDRFWELGGCDEAHGGWGQQGIEVACKAWLSGGSLKVNKKTWFAHWFRGDTGFPYPLSGKVVAKARDYSKDLWINNKWPLQKRNFEWLVEKFAPPSWENMNINSFMYRHIHTRNHHPRWKGIEVLKMPSDLQNYHEVLWEKQPDTIIEIGTKYGGTSLFLQDNFNGKVITIDALDQVKVKDPRITYLIGDSTSREIIDKVKELAKGKVMLIIDGNHSRKKVKWELYYYSPLVTSGQYLVIEDCFSKEGFLYGPGQARDWFLKTHKDFKQTDLDKNFLVGFCVGGWLIKQ
jgi:cephalosporin hydroxylase